MLDFKGICIILVIRLLQNKMDKTQHNTLFTLSRGIPTHRCGTRRGNRFHLSYGTKVGRVKANAVISVVWLTSARVKLLWCDVVRHASREQVSKR